MKKIIIFIGFVLIGLAFASAAWIGVIALREGGGPVAYSAAGKPAIFLPGVHLVLVLIVVVIAVWILIQRIAERIGTRKDEEQEDKESDPD